MSAMLSEIEVVNLKVIGDNRGSLIAIEDFDLPFYIKRVYYIYKTKTSVSRGFHAHKNLSQLLIAVSGAVTIRCIDSTFEEKIIRLNSPSTGILFRGVVWREMFDFTEDAVLLVLASENYDEGDYIRNFQDFKKIHEKKE